MIKTGKKKKNRSRRKIQVPEDRIICWVRKKAKRYGEDPPTPPKKGDIQQTN